MNFQDNNSKGWRPIKKVLLINPPLSGEERYGALALGGVYMPPLGLAILAAVLRREGFEAAILDCEALALNKDQALQAVLSNNPDFIGITAVTMAIDNAAQLAQLLKDQVESKIALGGVHISAMPVDTMRLFPWFDYGIYGEGEITLIELLQRLNRKESLEGLKGLLFYDNGTLVQNQPRPFINNLDEIPYPAWNLLPDLTTFYRPSVFGFKKLPSMAIITSRGCPGRCTFCYHGLFGNRYRFHSAEYIVGMVKHLSNHYGIRNIDIYDDTFVVNRQRLKRFCELMIEMDRDLVWSANARVNMVNPEILALMKRAGCWLISYGIENGDQVILDELKKDIKLDQVERAVRWTHEAGIKTRGFFMVGTVPETRESMDKTLKLLLKLPLDFATINHFSPFPGSEDFNRVTTRGEFKLDWRSLNQHTASFIPQGLSVEEIEQAITKMTRAFYLRPRILWHFIGMMLNPSHCYHLLKGGLAFLKFAFLRK